jgi:hypothetical protein
MPHQSYRDVFVSNNPALFKSGFSDALAIGQIGIFIYDVKKDQVAVFPPNYATTKTIQIIQGTPELPGNLLGAVANASDRSKPIKGKKITGWSGRAAERGQNQIVALGYAGDGDLTKNITALCEQSKTVFIKLSGGPIDEIFHTEGKGYVKQFNVFSGCCDDCGDDCAAVSAEAIADQLVDQINNDAIMSLGTRTGNKLIRAKKVTGDVAPDPDDTCQEYLLSICDNGDDTSLGLVQSQSPGIVITRKDRFDSTSVYAQVIPTDDPAPADFSNEGLVLINDCGVCPSGAGYVSVGAGFAYKVNRADAGDAGALTTLKTDYGIEASAPAEVANRVIFQFGQSTYIIVSETEISAAVGTDVIEFLGETRNSCILETPTLVEWTLGDEYNRFAKTYTISLRDNVCGVSRLEELQAAYPDLVISQASAGDCVRVFTTEVLSNCVPPNCPADAPTWIAPDAFQGIQWKADTTTGTATNVGVIIESAFVDRVTGECAFDYWRYDAEPIFIEVSQHSQDYNDKPTVCADEWPTTVIQEAKLPIGVGSRVREEENFFKGYRREYRDPNPIVRELQNSILQTDPNKFYDQYTLAFDFDYHQPWFSEKYTDSYRLEIYFPEGQGKEYEGAINSYVASVGIDLDPVVL